MPVKSRKKPAVQVDIAKRFCNLPRITPTPLAPGMSPERASLILKNNRKWVNGTNLHYYFFDKEGDASEVEYTDGSKALKTWQAGKKQQDVVREAFDTWKKAGIGLSFTEVKAREDAEIRIGFLEDDGSWSYIGRDILKQPANTRTMNFGWNLDTPDTHNGIDTAIHEIGHTLGFPHEHQNPFAGIKWDEEAVYTALGNPPNNWPRTQTYDNIIKKLSPAEVSGSTWDPNSVMHYPFEPGLILLPEEYREHGITPAGGLSRADIKWALSFYPALTGKPVELALMTSTEIIAKNAEQQDYSFTPAETRLYSIQTFGKLDTVMVLSEKKENKELQYLSGDDNSGEDKNALIKMKLFRGHQYILKIRVYYKNPKEKTAVMVW